MRSHLGDGETGGSCFKTAGDNLTIFILQWGSDHGGVISDLPSGINALEQKRVGKRN